MQKLGRGRTQSESLPTSLFQAASQLIVGINVMLGVVACMLVGAFELTMAPLNV